MADTTNPAAIIPYGTLTLGIGAGLYGTGLTVLTVYPQAAGTYWSYLGTAPEVNITPQGWVERSDTHQLAPCEDDGFRKSTTQRE